jgi:ribosome-associated protein
VVVHIMHPTVRSFYNLEEVWGGKEVKLQAAKPVAKKKPAARKKATKRGKAPRRRARR